MPPPSDASTVNTPLPPSVEKAYYRKCIELKRRLTEVEAANDETKIRRVRLDRGIMKMRLERAFLLDELRKRMEHGVDGSDGSGDEEMATPPVDRPHRDKRRRHLPPASSGPQPSASSHAHQSAPQPTPPVARVPSQPETRPAHSPSYETAAAQQQSAPAPPPVPSLPSQPLAQIPTTPYGASADARQVNGSNLDSTDSREPEYHTAPTNRGAGATGEALSAGPAMQEDANGDGRIVSNTSVGDANVEGAQ